MHGGRRVVDARRQGLIRHVSELPQPVADVLDGGALEPRTDNRADPFLQGFAGTVGEGRRDGRPGGADRGSADQ
jgi:hypothetical protein